MISKLNSLLATIGSFLKHILLLIIRLYWGWQFAIDGWAKLHNLDKVAGYFASLNIPAPKANAALTAIVQLVFGILLAVGLCSRLSALILAGVMCVAYVTAESPALHAIFSDTDKFFAATPFLFLYASVIVFCLGPGVVSLDALIFRRKKD